MKFCHSYCERWRSYQLVIILSNKMELFHTNQELHSFTWSSPTVNLQNKIFFYLIALTSILVIMLSGLYWKPKFGNIIISHHNSWRSERMDCWRLKNGKPYCRILFPEQSTCLEGVFAWLFWRTSNIFIHFNYCVINQYDVVNHCITLSVLMLT